MQNEVLHQSRCFHSSPEYCRTFWGRLVWIYEGKGSLTLTTTHLSFQGESLNFDVPLEAIRGIGLSEFSRASKPFGLFSLVVRYEVGGKEFVTHLVPHLSSLAPTWQTNQIVLQWFDTLRAQPVLAERVDSPLIAFPKPMESAQSLAAMAMILGGLTALGGVLGSAIVFIAAAAKR